MLPVDQTDQMAVRPLLTALRLLHAQTTDVHATGHAQTPSLPVMRGWVQG